MSRENFTHLFGVVIRIRRTLGQHGILIVGQQIISWWLIKERCDKSFLFWSLHQENIRTTCLVFETIFIARTWRALAMTLVDRVPHHPRPFVTEIFFATHVHVNQHQIGDVEVSNNSCNEMQNRNNRCRWARKHGGLTLKILIRWTT